ncbi:MAG: hypothetical protein ACOY6E_03285 [Pseudomonadota bacterium]
MSSWLKCVLLWLAACGAVQATDAGPANSADDTTADVRRAQTEAESRHTRALRDCAGRANYAGCVRDADAVRTETLRELTGERQRRAVPPGVTSADGQRVQGQRLIRELEQSAPRPARPTGLQDPGAITPHR